MIICSLKYKFIAIIVFLIDTSFVYFSASITRPSDIKYPSTPLDASYTTLKVVAYKDQNGAVLLSPVKRNETDRFSFIKILSDGKAMKKCGKLYDEILIFDGRKRTRTDKNMVDLSQSILPYRSKFKFSLQAILIVFDKPLDTVALSIL